MSIEERLSANLENTMRRIERAAARSGRSAGDIKLIAVTKNRGPDEVRAAAGAGIEDVGENKAQEMRAKQEALAGLDINWHFIGVLQRNKARLLVGRTALIQSVDSIELGVEIDKGPPGLARSSRF